MSVFSTFFQKRLSAPGPNLFKKLYLVRKVFFTNLYRTYNSNYGEDVVLRQFFLKDVRSGFFVDVGCFHPRKFNNTYKLYKKGWRGINIDLNEFKIEAFDLLRPEDINVFAAISDQEAEVEVYEYGHLSVNSTLEMSAVESKSVDMEGKRTLKTKTLTSVIEGTRFAGRQIDLLSVDTEGHDLNVLKSLDFEVYQPKIILVETFLNNLEKILQSDLYVFLKEKGYYLVNWVGLTLVLCHANCDIVRPEIDYK